MTDNALYEKGKQLAAEAVELDEKKQGSKALDKYMDAVQCFSNYLKYVKAPQVYQSVKEKVGWRLLAPIVQVPLTSLLQRRRSNAL